MAGSARRAGLFRRLRDDRRGVSAVEFAMLAPAMIAMYFGLAEFCQGFMAQKRAGHSAAIVADLITQRNSITGAELDDLFNVGGQIMKPFSSATLRLRASSVTRGNDDVNRVDWSRGKGMTARAAGSTVTLPAGLVERGQTVIFTETTYDYDSPVDYLMPAITRFSHSFYMRPRQVETIPYTP
ncbi:TadE/TadG family type IV pilus assembly protein [Brevundimonas fluminis]|jgi:Flp pilus assembly protein TadG|uniref:TadE/TadG family type IV pilus assembly protein n=1 Tax=Brevundimonas fluminis TaxID=2487274 RepID=UPI0013DDBAE9|nr:TadE/TadG family type IV pilus assembly protein [Brevundimonas fluminis]